MPLPIPAKVTPLGMVDGRVVVRDRQLTTVDLDALRLEAADRSAALLRRAGIEVPHRWPIVAAADYRAEGQPS